MKTKLKGTLTCQTAGVAVVGEESSTNALYWYTLSVPGWEIKQSSEFEELLNADSLGEDGNEEAAEAARAAFFKNNTWKEVIVITESKNYNRIGRQI